MINEIDNKIIDSIVGDIITFFNYNIDNKFIFQNNRYIIYNSIIEKYKKYLYNNLKNLIDRMDKKSIISFFYKSPFIETLYKNKIILYCKQILSTCPVELADLPTTTTTNYIFIYSSFNYLYSYREIMKNLTGEKLFNFVDTKLYFWQPLDIRMFINQKEIYNFYDQKLDIYKEKIKQEFDGEKIIDVYPNKSLLENIEQNYDIKNDIIPDNVKVEIKKITKVMNKNNLENFEKEINNLVFNKDKKQYYLKEDKEFNYPILCGHLYNLEMYKYTADTKYIDIVNSYILNGSCKICYMLFSNYYNTVEYNYNFIDNLDDYTDIAMFYIKNEISSIENLEDFKNLIAMFVNKEVNIKKAEKRNNDSFIYNWIIYISNMAILTILKYIGYDIEKLRDKINFAYKDNLEGLGITVKILYSNINNKFSSLLEHFNSITNDALSNPEWIINKLNLSNIINETKIEENIKLLNNINYNLIAFIKLYQFYFPKINIIDIIKLYELKYSYKGAENNNIYMYICPKNMLYHKFNSKFICENCNYDLQKGLTEEYYNLYKDEFINYDYHKEINFKDHILSDKKILIEKMPENTEIIKIDGSNDYIKYNNNYIKEYNNIIFDNGIADINISSNIIKLKIKQYFNNLGFAQIIKKISDEDLLKCYKSHIYLLHSGNHMDIIINHKNINLNI